MQEQILIIDDSISIHNLIKAHLATDEIVIHSAFDGESGLTRAQQYHPSLILLDVDMPQMDGFGVIKSLIGNKETATFPVIFLTADFATTDKVRGLELGAIDYITKPCNYDELNARVKAALRTKTQSDQIAKIDGLTGLWNMTYLKDHLVTQIGLSQRTGKPLSCIVADVDELSKINAQFGWNFGNEVLRSVSSLILAQCRAEDAVCYCGNGKFSVLINGMDRRAASRLADRQCRDIQQKCATIHGKDVVATCSFGVADTAVSEDNTLLERAEGAMIRAKQSGRSIVSIARPPRMKLAA